MKNKHIILGLSLLTLTQTCFAMPPKRSHSSSTTDENKTLVSEPMQAESSDVDLNMQEPVFSMTEDSSDSGEPSDEEQSTISSLPIPSLSRSPHLDLSDSQDVKLDDLREKESIDSDEYSDDDHPAISSLPIPSLSRSPHLDLSDSQDVKLDDLREKESTDSCLFSREKARLISYKASKTEQVHSISPQIFKIYRSTPRTNFDRLTTNVYDIGVITKDNPLFIYAPVPRPVSLLPQSSGEKLVSFLNPGLDVIKNSGSIIKTIRNLGNNAPVKTSSTCCIPENVFEDILNHVIPILSSEPALLRLDNPIGTTVVGDIHGDLDSLKEIFINFVNNFCSGNVDKILFLGDYTDRNSDNIEVSSLLYAMKTMMPNNVYLLRGNHESMHLQYTYTLPPERPVPECQKITTTLYSDIKKIYGDPDNVKINLVDNVYSQLSLAAIVGGEESAKKCFCMHGGLCPITWPSQESFCIQNIDQIQKPIIIPEDKDVGFPLVTSLLWSESSLKYGSSNGFRFNDMRGVGFISSVQQVYNFLKENNLDTFISGHVHSTTLTHCPEIEHSAIHITLMSSTFKQNNNPYNNSPYNNNPDNNKTDQRFVLDITPAPALNLRPVKNTISDQVIDTLHLVPQEMQKCLSIYGTIKR